MSDIKNMGVSIDLDMPREMVFNLNVIDACVDKFGKMDDIFAALNDFNAVKWLAVEMVNEGTEIWNEDHPDNKKPLIDNKRLCRYVIGVYGFQMLQQKVNEAILKGLPEDKVREIEEAGKKMIAAQEKKAKK